MQLKLQTEREHIQNPNRESHINFNIINTFNLSMILTKIFR